MHCRAARNHVPAATVKVTFSICRGLATLALAFGALAAWGYDAKLHQQFTFLAAKQYNSCVAELGLKLEPFTPLQVRFVARANVQQSQSNLFTRLFRWNYYNRKDQSSNNWLWVVDTRFHAHFSEVQQRLRAPRSEAAGYRDLGRVANYVQTVTSPARAVPVYVGRWWRLNMTDRFDDYPLDAAVVAQRLNGNCDVMSLQDDSYADILQDVATQTLEAVRTPISGMPATWEAFWTPDTKAGNFGEYGPAGNNFGRETTFRCADAQRCVLLDDDPLYQEFAQDRHLAAVLGTIRVMRLASQGADTP